MSVMKVVPVEVNATKWKKHSYWNRTRSM